MAINIQEILHPSDSDSIKFSKINYNFDQLVVNGGGPAGPKGEIGNTGSIGQTGATGNTGDKGNKGDSGETTSPWKNIAIDLNLSDGKNNVRILKPKPGTDLETPVIWLGDSSFLDEGINASDGDTTLRSTLNVGRHYDFVGSSVNAEYATFWHNANAKIKLDSEDVSDGSSNYTRFNLSAVEPIVVSSNPEDIRFSINLPTTHTGEFRLNNFNITGNFEDGMLRYNSGANQFEGYINNAWVELCTAPCGSGGSNASISISGTNLNLNNDGSLSGSQPTFEFSDWSGNVSVNAAGAVSIANGNSTLVTTDPVGPVAENITAGTNNVSFSVTVTVPSGYDNVANTVAGSVTVTQPTSYVAPNVETFILNQNEGASAGNYDIDSVSLIIGNSNGATENSSNSTSSGVALSVDAIGGTTIQIEILASASNLREFLADPVSQTSGLTHNIISQTLSNNDQNVRVVSNIVLPASGGTSNSNIEASTQSNQVTGNFDYTYGNTSGEVCDANPLIGVQEFALPVTTNSSSTISQWYSAAMTAASAHAGATVGILPGGGYISVSRVEDENGQDQLFTNQQYLQINSTGQWMMSPANCPSAQPSTTTTTAAPPIFEWSAYPSGTGTTSAAPVYVNYDSTSGSNIQQFDWNGGALEGGSAAVSHFNWTNWTNMSTDPTIGIPAVYVSNSQTDAENKIDNHTGGNGYAAFFFPHDTITASAQQGPNANGLLFDGTSTLHADVTFDVVASETGLWTAIMASCHLAGTVMNLADGTTKLVEDLEAGDVLASYSITGLGTDENEQSWETYSADATGWSATQSTTTVTFVNEGSFNEYYNFNNDLTKVTREHPVLVKAGDSISFKRADAVVEGDSFYINGAWVEITSIELVATDSAVTTYTIGVEEEDVYLADGILWHNAPGGNK